MKTRLILPLAFIFAISCASFPTAPQIVERIPDVVQTFDGNVSQAVDLSLNYLEVAITKAEQAESAYQLIAGFVSPTLHAQVRAGFRNIGTLIVRAVDGIQRGVATWAQFRDLLQPIVSAMNHLNDWMRQLQPAAAAPASPWKALAGELTTMVAKAAMQKVLR